MPLQQVFSAASSPLSDPQKCGLSPLTAWQYPSTVTPHQSLIALHPRPRYLSQSFSLLGSDYGWVVGSIRQRGILAVVQEAVAPAAIADEEKGSEENQGTDGARLPLQQEAQQVEAHEHGVVKPQRWVQRFGDEQYREQPL